jgi:hypothetical protein
MDGAEMSIDACDILCSRVNEYLREIGHPLFRDKMTKQSYVPFKFGRGIKNGHLIVVAVGINEARRCLELVFVVPKDIASRNAVIRIVHTYVDRYQHVKYEINDPNVDLEQFKPLLLAAVRHIADKRS